MTDTPGEPLDSSEPEPSCAPAPSGAPPFPTSRLLVGLAGLTLGAWFFTTALALAALGLTHDIGLLLLAQGVGQVAGIVVAISMLRLLVAGDADLAERLGVRIGPDLLRRLEIGLRWYALSLPGLLLISALLAYLGHRYHFSVGRPEVEKLFSQVNRSPVTLLLAALVLSVGAPLFEELVFRGFLFAALRQRVGPVVTIAVTALLFALLHDFSRTFADPRTFPFAILYLGGVLGLVRERTGSVAPGMAVHALNNLVALILTLLNPVAR